MNYIKERSFIDTKILIYTDDADSPEKQAIAVALIESGWQNGNAVLSTQVLQEYFSASIEHQDIVRAIELHRLHSFSFWDSLIVRMAQKTGCTVLYSEDMQHGQKLSGLRIINPFNARATAYK